MNIIRYGRIPLTKHVCWEMELYTDFLVELCFVLRVRTKEQDHKGIYFEFGFGKVYFTFQIYDDRHKEDYNI